ncbi:MAG: hypothetical protein HOF10_12085 [Chloroflexi bacterium]|nr:hypothetical protein [Chloroflexota bacterium]
MKSITNSLLFKITQIGSDPKDSEDLQLKKSMLLLTSIPFVFAGLGINVLHNQ